MYCLFSLCCVHSSGHGWFLCVRSLLSWDWRAWALSPNCILMVTICTAPAWAQPEEADTGVFLIADVVTTLHFMPRKFG